VLPGHLFRAGIHAFGTVKTGKLRTIPDVNAQGTCLDAGVAAKAFFGPIRIKGDDERPIVEEDALNFCVGAYGFTEASAQGDDVEEKKDGQHHP
jgi:hypothetical protein